MDNPWPVVLPDNVHGYKSLDEYIKLRDNSAFKDIIKPNEAQQVFPVSQSGSPGQKRLLTDANEGNSEVSAPPAKTLRFSRWIPDPEIFKCTPKMEEQVTRMRTVVDPLTDDNSIICAFNSYGTNLPIAKNSFITLYRGECVDAVMIDWYIKFTLQEISDSRLYAYTCNNYNYEKQTMEASLGINAFQYETIFIPVIKMSHYILIVIRVAEKRVKVYDSQGGEYPQVIKAILKFLKVEAKAFFGDGNKVFKKTEWNLPLKEKVDENIPKQTNTYDCGVFVCQFVAFIARGEPLDFKEADLIYARIKMQYEMLMHGKRCDEANQQLLNALKDPEIEINLKVEKAVRVSKRLAIKTNHAVKPDVAKCKSSAVVRCTSFEFGDRNVQVGSDEALVTLAPSSSYPPSSSTLSVAPFVSDLDSFEGSSLNSFSPGESFAQIDSSLSPLDASFAEGAVHNSAPNTPMSMDTDIGLGAPSSPWSSSSAVHTELNASSALFTASSSRQESPTSKDGDSSSGTQSPSVFDNLDESTGDSSIASASHEIHPASLSSLATSRDASPAPSNDAEAAEAAALMAQAVKFLQDNSPTTTYSGLPLGAYIPFNSTLLSSLGITEAKARAQTMARGSLDVAIAAANAALVASELSTASVVPAVPAAQAAPAAAIARARNGPKTTDDYLAELPIYVRHVMRRDIQPRKMELLEGQGIRGLRPRDEILNLGLPRFGDYKIGDLVWAKSQLLEYSHWPAMIVVDPFYPKGKDKRILRNEPPIYTTMTNEGEVAYYHVQFLGNEQSTEWLPASRVDAYIPYTRYKEEVLKPRLEALYYAKDKAKFVKEESVKVGDMEAWTGALEEAEYMVRKSTAERIKFTFKYVERKRLRKSK